MSEGNVMEKVLELSKKIWDAMQKEDIATLKEWVHEDALFVHMGVTLSRDDELDVIKERRIVYKEIEFEETTVKEIASTIIVLTKLKLTAIVGGNEVTNPFVVTEVYTNSDEGIRLASMSYTRIVY